MSTSYALAEGRHACTIGDTAIVMDTVKDRYFCFPGLQAAWFAEIVERAPKSDLSHDADRFAERLCERGILTVRGAAGAGLDNIAPSLPAADDGKMAGGTEPKIRLTHLIRMATSFVMLRHLQIAQRRNLPGSCLGQAMKAKYTGKATSCQ